MKITDILETMDYGEAPESPQPALDWVAANGGDFGLFIDGNFIKPKGRASFNSNNPANNELIAHLCQAEQADVDSAVAAARAAQVGRAV